jgi:hypothetical protein
MKKASPVRPLFLRKSFLHTVLTVAFRHAPGLTNFVAGLGMMALGLYYLARHKKKLREETKSDNLFFTQERKGQNGEIFKIVKIKTMRDGPGSDRERLGPLGEKLRRAKKDELFQGLNIMARQMNLIGYRPLKPDIDESLMRDAHPNAEKLYKSKPGMMSFAALEGRNGAKDEDPTKVAERNVKRDMSYCDLLERYPGIKPEIEAYLTLVIARTIKRQLNDRPFSADADKVQPEAVIAPASKAKPTAKILIFKRAAAAAKTAATPLRLIWNRSIGGKNEKSSAEDEPQERQRQIKRRNGPGANL